ncbi:uncharacterized protein LOC131651153 [Vicia villosa]|uniref:uncharacterized protein LOC131651153 n=1 Tax=Vicia villosa TaxID=3911 RepID=UPI00273ACC9D|nr:uncharacterized protein LOC131651153 [Vicia villosa]
MRILSWNCRGLSSPSAIPNLKKLAQQHRPDVIFLAETLSNSRKLENIRVMLNFDACLSVDVEGRSGGIAVLWKNTDSCSIINYTRNFVNVIVTDKDNSAWILTCYYGYPERSRRKLALDLLREIRYMSSLPWCVIGDFNDLLSQQDKNGRLPHPNWLCSGFRQAVSDCNLSDISLEGYQFTWVKSRGTDHMIEEILDRALANSYWLATFPHAKLTNLIASHSNHSPILLDCDPIQQASRSFQFRFENSWLHEDGILLRW